MERDCGDSLSDGKQDILKGLTSLMGPTKTTYKTRLPLGDEIKQRKGERGEEGRKKEKGRDGRG